jgi:hypothetical protein
MNRGAWAMGFAGMPFCQGQIGVETEYSGGRLGMAFALNCGLNSSGTEVDAGGRRFELQAVDIARRLKTRIKMTASARGLGFRMLPSALSQGLG